MTTSYHLLAGPGVSRDSITDAGLSELYRHPDPGDRAWVRTNFVSTLDGAAQGPDGRSGSINTASDRKVFALQRAHADVILIGAGTARAEHYRAVDLEPWQRELRSRLGLAPYPTLAIISRSRDLPDDLARPAAGEQGGPVILIAPHATGEARPTPDHVELIELDDHDLVPCKELITALADRGLRRVLCEGGPHLSRQLHAAGLVDEICLTLSPLVIGGHASRTTAGALLEPEPYELAHCIAADDQALLLRYLRGHRAHS
ncbi:pyrimidine reductase family protein [Microlunatus elymi]|uniref:pyrimidine reductase family protein n=1 Tax=Microlunatus elymi TaxID=2596828 RepID=UPI00143D68AF|nr:pyrimidine reductase family protein [Microlunatus elymi]